MRGQCAAHHAPHRFRRLDGRSRGLAPVLVGDGRELETFENTAELNPTNDARRGRSRTYDGRMNRPETRAMHKRLTPAHRLVLFHYATRSYDEFVSVKLTRKRGGATTVNNKADHFDVADMAAFEHRRRFDGNATVCASAVKARYAQRCCRGRSAARLEWIR